MKPTNGIRTFDAKATALAFPLGGIGTGNVSLGARGELRDWEIFNSPAKGNQLPNTFFAIRTQTQGQEPVTRVIEGPIQPPHDLSHGYHPATTAGLPRLLNTTFRGEYPIATIDFADPALPVHIQLEAFTPLIPLNPDDSGIPCAILTFSVTNTSPTSVDLTLVASLTNPTGGIQRDQFGNIKANARGRTVNEYRDETALRGLYMYAEGIEPDDLAFGNMSLVTDHHQVTVKRSWLRGAWYDFLRDFWDDLTDDGLLTDLEYATPGSSPDTGSLGLLDNLEPGDNSTYRFIISWYFPNRINSWGETHVSRMNPSTTRHTRNHYATLFDSAWRVAQYGIDQLPRLEASTQLFHDALFGTTLAPEILEAVSANIVPVRSNTCFWLEDGRFFGWEGCFDDAGCCPGTCTHVWSYAQTVAFLFPSLEREMRRLEFEVETAGDGYMAFRTFKTFDQKFIWEWGDQKPEAAIDGQMGSILRGYREWKLSGDKGWLTQIWPGVKLAMDYASAIWDTDGDGVPDGKQHTTYDIEFYGPNPLGGIYYLAALRAVSELAHVMDEPQLAERCGRSFERGSQRLDALLWNGEYYVQRLASIDEHPYQHATGCLSDQLLGQLHAYILGMGALLPVDHLRAAVKAIFKYNFHENFWQHVNCQRGFVLNDEAGLVLCSWPNKGRPRFPFPYSDEVWTGVEYEVASLLIYQGCLDEGLTLLKAMCARHDGLRRNPWNEVECGHHYARSMSSWALLLAASGFQSEFGRGKMSFSPIAGLSTVANEFRTLWSNGHAWGTFAEHWNAALDRWESEISVLGGNVEGIEVTSHGLVLGI